MLKETEGRGPYCSLVMAVVVVKDVVTFLGFAINIELLQAVSLTAPSLFEYPYSEMEETSGMSIASEISINMQRLQGFDLMQHLNHCPSGQWNLDTSGLTPLAKTIHLMLNLLCLLPYRS